MSHKITVAIDGPGGSGKSTAARECARRLGYVYLDTGAMYRAVTLKALENKVDPKDSKKVAEIAHNIKIELKPSDKITHIIVDDKDRSEDIRSPEVNRNVSAIASNPEVRSHLVSLQRELGKDGGVFLDGRDIGTVVFPNAELKIYMEADPNERANRRFKEFEQKGTKITLDEVLKDINDRDKADTERDIAPLKKADDAVVIDTTKQTLEETITEVIKLVHQTENKLSAK